mmetsp:Transcript_14705/g.21636  ORF Transcript_14705/g.21636 Transcript_14705/m.21636 type:complete len:228 (-) Transcript_14705:1300-1983(-)
MDASIFLEKIADVCRKVPPRPSSPFVLIRNSLTSSCVSVSPLLENLSNTSSSACCRRGVKRSTTFCASASVRTSASSAPLRPPSNSWCKASNRSVNRSFDSSWGSVVEALFSKPEKKSLLCLFISSPYIATYTDSRSVWYSASSKRPFPSRSILSNACSISVSLRFCKSSPFAIPNAFLSPSRSCWRAFSLAVNCPLVSPELSPGFVPKPRKKSLRSCSICCPYVAT